MAMEMVLLSESSRNCSAALRTLARQRATSIGAFLKSARWNTVVRQGSNYLGPVAGGGLFGKTQTNRIRTLAMVPVEGPTESKAINGLLGPTFAKGHIESQGAFLR